MGGKSYELADAFGRLYVKEEERMSVKTSAGLLLYRNGNGPIEVLIAHMGGPFWARKDHGAWSIPKGEYDEGEDPVEVARREFEEEMGTPPPGGSLLELGEVKQPSGKRIVVFALESDFDTTNIESNTFSLEWPKGSGTIKEFPEIDRAEWMPYDLAREKLVKGQVEFVDRLLARLGREEASGESISASAEGPLSLF